MSGASRRNGSRRRTRWFRLAALEKSWDEKKDEEKLLQESSSKKAPASQKSEKHESEASRHSERHEFQKSLPLLAKSERQESERKLESVKNEEKLLSASSSSKKSLKVLEGGLKIGILRELPLEKRAEKRHHLALFRGR